MREMERFLEQWEMDVRDVRRRLLLAPTPRERERWHAIWLLAQGGLLWSLGRHWKGTPTPLAGGPPPLVRAVRRHWCSSSPVVPPRPGRGATGGV